MDGGTFTISNGGVFGSLYGTPIINPPQSAILGMHAIQDRPVAREGKVSPMLHKYLEQLGGVDIVFSSCNVFIFTAISTVGVECIMFYMKSKMLSYQCYMHLLNLTPMQSPFRPTHTTPTQSHPCHAHSISPMPRPLSLTHTTPTQSYPCHAH